MSDYGDSWAAAFPIVAIIVTRENYWKSGMVLRRSKIFIGRRGEQRHRSDQPRVRESASSQLRHSSSSILRDHRVTIGENLVFLRGFSENSFASLINRARARRRARARMAWLGLLRSPGRGIVEDRSA